MKSRSTWPLAASTAILLALVVPATLAGCGEADAETSRDGLSVDVAPEAPGTRVEVAKLSRTATALDITVPGEVEGSRDALLATPSGGYVEAVLATEGQHVSKGKALARINTAMMSAQQDQVEAQLAQARADLERMEALGDLAAEAQLQGARTQVAVLEANLKVARINTSRSMVVAPFAGVVSQVGVEEGEVAGPGNPVARLIQLDPVLVTVSVSDRDIGALSVGLPATIRVDALGQPFEGVLTHLDPASDPRTRSFMAKIEVANSDGLLKPGMIASARLKAGGAEDAIVLPQDWIVTSRKGLGVFVVEEDRAVWRPVTPGAVIHDQVVIDAGLAEDERIVITGHRTLVDGDPLIIAREGACCTNGRATF